MKNRIVGECTWKGSGSEYLIDGRKTFAKRYIYIINADCLEEAVLPDGQDSILPMSDIRMPYLLYMTA
ncbi:hypothetical protein [Chitinophaga pinensis]|uniref:Uncharacterized protein n=1 Tax=Chitinophaga pinensis TaxID=79329 RepID=A0A5C6LN73_9BACT|nr:hypothetical protein [Chitinophaga pinensis]TWV88969.1 hypothetical protein FEF09_30215 [Chitinophaga pinensis]